MSLRILGYNPDGSRRILDEGPAHASMVSRGGLTLGQAVALEQLATVRATAKDLVEAEPKRPLAIDRERAALVRLEAKVAEISVDWQATAVARGAVARLTAAAARGEAIAAARAALETAKAATADATAESANILALGQQVASQLTTAKAKVADLAELRSERDRVQAELTTVAERIHRLEDERHELERLLAAAEANVARLEQLQAEHDELVATTAAAAAELGILREFITAFGVTGIPARIIESVIPELEGYANELLADLRPGMELSIRAQRAKKDGSGIVEALDLVVRDAAGERPLALFSGGERMSVSLAIAVALSRLVARRAGAAIRTLVVDEPDGLDADARRAFGQALRVLAHHGELERVVLVSHHEDLAEYGDSTYRVTKDGRGSVVEQVA